MLQEWFYTSEQPKFNLSGFFYNSERVENTQMQLCNGANQEEFNKLVATYEGNFYAKIKPAWLDKFFRSKEKLIKALSWYLPNQTDMTFEQYCLSPDHAQDRHNHRITEQFPKDMNLVKIYLAKKE